MVNWKNLIATDMEGDTCELGEMIANGSDIDITLVDYKKVLCSGYFISAPGEDPDFDTPRGSVDWTGFEGALREARRANAAE